MIDKTSNLIASQTMDDNFTETARYVRITITGGLNSGNWASFFEFKVFDGTYSISSKKNIASAGNDGNINSYWSAADGNAGHSWAVDLESNLNLTGSQVIWLTSDIAYKYKIETSADSTNWMLASDKTNNNSALQIETDNFNITARYVRITITGGTSNTNKAAFSEFRLFDGSYTTFNPAFVTINCVKPECTTCQVDSILIKPWVNINNAGWQQSGSALLCKGGNVSFSTLSSDTTGWLWNGPDGYLANTMQINLENIQLKDTGIYKVTHKNTFFNFSLNLVKDTISPFIEINEKPFIYGNTATVMTGDTVILSPMPPDSVGWKWSWTGPNGFSSTSRAVKIAANDTIQTGIYTSNGSDGFECGTVSQIFSITVEKGTGIPVVESANDIEIYPNPSHNGIFNLKNYESCKISVYNLMGYLICEKIENIGENVLDLSQQPRGIYIIRLLSDKTKSIKKVVIQ